MFAHCVTVVQGGALIVLQHIDIQLGLISRSLTSVHPTINFNLMHGSK